MRGYTEPFEVPDNVIKQFPIKEIKSNQNKGWVVIPKEVKSCICQIADKIKGVTIRSIIPCIVDNPNAHLLSVHGDNKKYCWQAFHGIHCLPLTSDYGIIHLAHSLHAKKRGILALVRGVVRMMKLWIDFRSFFCNTSLFLIMMIISVFLKH